MRRNVANFFRRLDLFHLITAHGNFNCNRTSSQDSLAGVRGWRSLPGHQALCRGEGGQTVRSETWWKVAVPPAEMKSSRSVPTTAASPSPSGSVGESTQSVTELQWAKHAEAQEKVLQALQAQVVSMQKDRDAELKRLREEVEAQRAAANLGGHLAALALNQGGKPKDPPLIPSEELSVAGNDGTPQTVKRQRYSDVVPPPAPLATPVKSDEPPSEAPPAQPSETEAPKAEIAETPCPTQPKHAEPAEPNGVAPEASPTEPGAASAEPENAAPAETEAKTTPVEGPLEDTKQAASRDPTPPKAPVPAEPKAATGPKAPPADTGKGKGKGKKGSTIFGAPSPKPKGSKRRTRMGGIRGQHIHDIYQVYISYIIPDKLSREMHRLGGM